MRSLRGWSVSPSAYLLYFPKVTIMVNAQTMLNQPVRYVGVFSKEAVCKLLLCHEKSVADIPSSQLHRVSKSKVGRSELVRHEMNTTAMKAWLTYRGFRRCTVPVPHDCAAAVANEVEGAT